MIPPMTHIYTHNGTGTDRQVQTDTNTHDLFQGQDYNFVANPELVENIVLNLDTWSIDHYQRDVLSGAVYEKGEIALNLSGTNDDLNPSGLEKVLHVFLNVTGLLATLSGIAGGEDGRILVLVNVGNANVTLQHNQGSSVGNRFFLPELSGLLLSPGESKRIRYRSATGFWYSA